MNSIQTRQIASARVASGPVRPFAVSRRSVGVRAGGKIIVEMPSEDKLKSLGLKSWPTWGCGVSKFPWSYDSTETAYVLEGLVVVTPDDGEPVEIKAGDLCTFPAGMDCTWDVKKPINKHYNFS